MNSKNIELAIYIYPLPKGTSYYKEDLQHKEKVIELFDYCQILEGVIYLEGWNFLIDKYGYEALYEIDKESGWFDSESIEEFIEEIKNEMKISPSNL
ncbi:hypothetical protein SAMN02745163_02930 [Clostridium cavendishii DSM 21758]|uniref:Uncharacterized protein n=1 Tax=Clostridium cavendishii DSM 21758 TaxID=1121302 RepID=A0A1M6NJY3_9CLOT|nr:hypothetical protein [Clostridium cavendishii]SHJ96051.1 hypothetical protein SAMN02745163_02930 [Clostridium cavendishii DSM 21758]